MDNEPGRSMAKSREDPLGRIVLATFFINFAAIQCVAKALLCSIVVDIGPVEVLSHCILWLSLTGMLY